MKSLFSKIKTEIDTYAWGGQVPPKEPVKMKPNRYPTNEH